MAQSLRKNEGAPGEDHQDDSISGLQEEIAVLEASFAKTKQELSTFEGKIHARLDKEIARVRELTELYKQQKREKKAKRLEQKKRGKNYVEPRQTTLPDKPGAVEAPVDPEQQRELKRLYKEAVVHVHPDKLMHSGEQDRIARANAITAQLNGIYKRGDLEELINFYEAILSGDALAEKGTSPEVLVDPRLRQQSLRKKKVALLAQLEQLRRSYTYTVLITYENPLHFIDELYLQFQERIKQLEKRTRKG